MIEKKIKYDINIEKPSKTKPVKQGGVLNYLGKQKTVSAPRRWRSSPKHPIAHLAYITKDEEKILIDLNLYGSLKGKPNKGPSGIMSLQGSGSGSGGGDSGGDSGGPGGSDSNQASEGTNATAADAAAANAAAAAANAAAANATTSDANVGPNDPGMNTIGSDGPVGSESMGQQDTFGSDVAEDTDVTDVDMTTPTMQTPQEKVSNFVANQFSPSAIAGRMVGSALFGIPGAIMGSMIGSDIGRGVTGPSDDTQEQSSVQTGPTPGSGGSGGITTIPIYAPLVNESTGSNTADALLAMYRANLRST